MNPPNDAFTAVVLAADRGPGDPVAEAAGVACKSLTPVGGRPMVLRVLDALDDARQVGRRILCGPPQSAVARAPALHACITSGAVEWIANEPTPSLSAAAVLKTLPGTAPVLLTTADHALLDAQMVDYFCGRARGKACDIVVGLASHAMVAAAYPQTYRTATRLRDGAYCGCNLFAFLTPRARLAADFWRRVESRRKKPLRLVAAVGWVAVLRYLLGRMTLDEGLQRISRRMGIRAGAVVLPFAEAAIDVDKVDDWRLVESIAAAKKL